MGRPTTLGQLKDSGYSPRSVRAEMRANLIAALSRSEQLFPGIVGYEETVIPELENAILSGHHVILLGERGQAKTRLIRAMVGLLDPEIPVVAGCEINDDPVAPVCAACRRRTAAEGDALAVAWLPRDRRYGEKLATPDVSMADLIGETDPIKLAEGRYMADEETLHFGIVPRTNRGLFAINELPDLAEKVQVGLFNLMEERDLQIKGHKIRLPLDLVVVATANPEDYTSRGRIVTPLKDRFDVQIRTHYPVKLQDEIVIMEQEVPLESRSGRAVRVPVFIKEIVARLTQEARAAPEVNQSSGVSVRVSINNYETVIANAEKRVLVHGDSEIVPRITDLHSLVPSTAGKLELEYGQVVQGEAELIDRLLSVAIKKTFDAHVEIERLSPIIEYIGEGWGVQVSDTMASTEYLEGIASISGLRAVIDELGPFESPGLMAAAAEFVFEGLHLHAKLNRDRQGGRFSYSA